MDRVRSRSPNGFTLIELTIVLAVIAILMAVIAPSIGGLINESKNVKAKRDLEVIGLSVIRIMNDVGPCLKKNATLLCTKANKVNLLDSDGPDVLTADVSGADLSNGEISGSPINWDDDGVAGASMKDQLILNTPVYLTPREVIFNNPNSSSHPPGWRGAYVSSPIGPDPWGKKYLVNTVFSITATDAASGTNEGQKSGGWSYDIFVISAGPNGLYETPFGQVNASPSGDDMIYVIIGDSH